MFSTERMPPAHGQGDETMLGGATDHIDHGRAVVGRRSDIEKHELIGLLGVVGHRRFHGITGVDQIDEVHAFDDAAIGHVQAGNDAFREHGGRKTRSGKDVHLPVAWRGVEGTNRGGAEVAEGARRKAGVER